MCAICRMYICPAACPSYEGKSLERGKPVAQCEECGEYIYADDTNIIINKNFALCRFCKEANDII